MAGSLFWLSDEMSAAIEPHLPKNQPGAQRVDDRRVISGVIHMLKSGGRWADVPAAYGPPTTIYIRWNRWSQRGVWRKLLATVAAQGPVRELGHLDLTTVKAHRSAHGGKGGRKRKQSDARGMAKPQRSTRFATSWVDPSR